MNCWKNFILILVVSVPGIGWRVENWKGWDTYQVILWSTGPPKDNALWFQRLREMGCTAEKCYRGASPAPFVQHGFTFYVENLLPQLAFLHSRKKLYDEDFRNATAAKDKRFLVRKPCLHDPTFWKEAEGALKSLLEPYVPHHPLLYNLQDELSIGSYASPMDYCFGPHTLQAFRKWLAEQYGSLEALNREWETGFSSWDDVAPMTTYEIKEREQRDLAKGKLENYAPWADHRAFMDLSFSRALDRLRKFIHTLDPHTPVGVEGTQMPSAWGGFDLWRLSQALDWIEPYDIASSREIFRSFLPAGVPVVGTIFGSDLPRIRSRLWRLLLHGDRGCIVWDDEKSRCVRKNEEGMPITRRGRELAGIFAELRSAAPLFFKLHRVTDPIAIHYSQASIRAHWMFDSREDGDTWPRRFSSYEAEHSRFAKVRDSFVRVIEDLGLQFMFVSYEEIEEGVLQKKGYKVLLLPQSVAMSRKECVQIEEFVRGGGTVIADNMTATMDEHCRRLPRGGLDRLFGIRRRGVEWSSKARGDALPSSAAEAVPLRAYEPGITLTAGRALRQVHSSLAVIENRTGKGRTIYLNLDMLDYSALRRTPPKGKDYLHLFGSLLKESGIEAPLKVLDGVNGQPVPCLEIWRYRGEGAKVAALMKNLSFTVNSTGIPEVPDQEETESRVKVQVILPEEARVTEVRTGRDLGVSRRVSVYLDHWSPAILKWE